MIGSGSRRSGGHRDLDGNGSAGGERDLERPVTLHTHHINQVATTLKELEAKSVLDLGCGEGKLLRHVCWLTALSSASWRWIISHRSLEVASAKLRLERMPDRQPQTNPDHARLAAVSRYPLERF